MPGSNCSIFGCPISRKTVGLAIFQVTKRTDEYNSQWSDKLVNIITRDRIIDQSLKKQIEKKNLHICELHFEEEKILRSRLFSYEIF